MTRSFEIVVGRILGAHSQQRTVGFVRTLHTTAQARHRLQRCMNELNPSTEITAFSDGDDGLRDLVPQATHVLD